MTRAIRGTWWAPLVMIAAYVPCSLLLFPRPILTLVSVVSFGIRLGLAYATAGVLLAALVTYWTGRLLNRDVVKRIAGDKLDAAAKPVKAHGVVTMFAANMMPTPPFAVQNIIAGAIRMKLWEFMLGTFLALIPGMIAWGVFGNQLNAAIEEASVSYWIMGAAVVLLAAFMLLTRWWLKRKGF